MYATRMCHNYFNVNEERVGCRVLEACFTEASSCLLPLAPLKLIAQRRCVGASSAEVCPRVKRQEVRGLDPRCYGVAQEEHGNRNAATNLLIPTCSYAFAFSRRICGYTAYENEWADNADG